MLEGESARMSRRSQRLVKGRYYQGEDDAASNSSTGSASGNPVSYRESPVRIFKKKSTTKRQTPQYSAYTSNESLASYTSDALEEPIKNWVSNVSMRNGSPGSRGSSKDKLLSSSGSTSPASDLLPPSSLLYNSNAYSDRVPATRKALSDTSSNRSSTYESHAPPIDPFGNSSGYSSEEDYIGRQQSDAGAAQGFALRDVLLLPGKAMGMLFWWLGTAWYCLTSGASLLDVFVLTRQSHFLKKAVVFLLALLLLGVGLWYLYPLVWNQSDTVVPDPVWKIVDESKAALSQDSKAPASKQDSALLTRLAAVERQLLTLSSLRESALEKVESMERELEREKEERGKQRERALTSEGVTKLIHTAIGERQGRVQEEERERVKEEITLLLQDREEKWREELEQLHHKSERVQTELSQMKSGFQGRLSEDHTRLLSELSRLEQQLHALRSEVTGLTSAQSTMQRELETLPATLHTMKTQVQSEVGQWLKQYLSETEGGAAASLVEREELQAALQELESRILERLSEERARRESDTIGMAHSIGDTLHLAGVGGVTEQAVHRIVQRAINLYRADGIGLVDYALESAGASVISTRCSETYETKTALLSLFGIPLWYHSQSPRVVIQPDVLPGNCWAFRGSHGFVVIELASRIRPTAVTLEHIPKSISPMGKIDSAPRDFAVYGLDNDSQEEGTLLGRFTYDQDGDPLQTYQLKADQMGSFGLVEFRVLSNWGHPEYTCVYRFRVHGEPVK